MDHFEHGHDASEIAVLAAVRVPGLDAWTVRVTVAHRDGPVHGWVPIVFWSEAAAEAWLDGRSGRAVRPSVRDCPEGRDDMAYAAVVDADGEELLVSEPLDRPKAAAVAAMLTAEFRSRSQADGRRS